MKLTSAIQESLVSLLLFDDSPGGAKYIRALVPPGTYDPYYREIALEAAEYIDRYGKAPGEHALDIVDSLVARSPDSETIYRRIFESIQLLKSSINREYVVAQAAAFSRYQGLRAGITEALEALKGQDEASVNLALAAIEKHVKKQYTNFNPGVLFSDPAQALRFLSSSDVFINIGIPELDSIDANPGRGQLFLFNALPNRGKSWFLIHVGKFCLLQGLRVLHLTLEMSEDQVSKRYAQNLFSVSKRQVECKVQTFKKDELGRFIGLEESVLKDRPSLRDPGIYNHLRRRITAMSGRMHLLIKQFPTGSLTMSELRAYLEAIEGQLSFIPDVILLDYADLMKTDAKYLRQELGVLYKELRGLAVEKNLAMVTCSQNNREAFGAKTSDERHVGEDISKIFTADTVLNFNQTESERALGLARLFVSKSRDDTARVTVLISQGYGVGQFCMDSARMDSSYWNSLPEEGQEEKKPS